MSWVFFFSYCGTFSDDIILHISADYGIKTCAGYPGSIQHIMKDAQVSTFLIKMF